MSQTSKFEQEVSDGQRFEFGKNWSSFLRTLNDERIEIAQNSISEMLGVDTLKGRTFLDIGCGSGLFSLVARKLGATVHSFDFDPNSVACAIELRNRYFPEDENWTIEEGSVLDDAFLRKLGSFEGVEESEKDLLLRSDWQSIGFDRLHPVFLFSIIPAQSRTS